MLIINNGTTVRSVKPFLLNTNKHNEEIVAPEKYHSGLVVSFNFGSTQAPKNKEKDDDNDNNNNTTKVVMMREKKVKPGAWIRALTNPKLYLYVFTLSIYIYIFPCKPNANIIIILYLLLQSICWKCFGVPCI